jgi:hypothetical protein
VGRQGCSDGKDRKILIPNNQTVDAVHQPALIKVAESKARLPQWEGPAWELTSAIADAAKLRYALVAPRLLAPHPNGEVEELSTEQAVALFVLQRFHDIERLKEKFRFSTQQRPPGLPAGHGNSTVLFEGGGPPVSVPVSSHTPIDCREPTAACGGSGLRQSRDV